MEHLIYGCRGKGTKPAESYHTAERGQQEAYPSNAAQGNTGYFKYVTDQAQSGLGIDKHRPSQTYDGFKHLSSLPYKHRVQNNKYIFNETLTPEYKERTENGLGQGREESQKSRPISYFG